MYALLSFIHSFYIYKWKTAILHLCFGTEKNRRMGSKKPRYNRGFRGRHLFCLHSMVGEDGFEPSKPKQQIYSLSPLTTRELSQIQRWLLYHRTSRMSRKISNFLRDFWDCAPRRGAGGFISLSVKGKRPLSAPRVQWKTLTARRTDAPKAVACISPSWIILSALSFSETEKQWHGTVFTHNMEGFLPTSRNCNNKRISA